MQNDEKVGVGKRQIFSPYCPTCGKQNTIKQSPEWLLTHFKGKMAAILSILLQSRKDKRTVSMTEIGDFVYADEDSPPVTMNNLLSVVMSRNRKKLMRLGWDIAGPQTTGTGFYLVELERDF